MKTTLTLLLLSALILSRQSDSNDKRGMLIHRWKQFAYRMHKDSFPSRLPLKGLTQMCQFNQDGTYWTETTSMKGDYSSKGIGSWSINDSRTKLDIAIDTLDDRKQQFYADSSNKYRDTIIRLNRDTLILGNSWYDWHYVRDK